jgi:hypothetical protein
MRNKRLYRDSGHETARAKNVTLWEFRIKNLWTQARNRVFGVPDGFTEVTVTVASDAEGAYSKIVRNVSDADVAFMLETVRDARPCQ